MSRKRPAGGSRAPSDEARQDVRTRLDEAHAAAALCDRLTAREICAQLVRDDMLTIEANTALLVRLADVLLLAGGLEQLSRVLRAVGGGRVDILCSTSVRLTTDRDFVVSAAGGGVCVMIDESVAGRPGGTAGCDIVRAITNRQPLLQ